MSLLERSHKGLLRLHLKDYHHLTQLPQIQIPFITPPNDIDVLTEKNMD